MSTFVVVVEADPPAISLGKVQELVSRESISTIGWKYAADVAFQFCVWFHILLGDGLKAGMAIMVFFVDATASRFPLSSYKWLPTQMKMAARMDTG